MVPLLDPKYLWITELAHKHLCQSLTAKLLRKLDNIPEPPLQVDQHVEWRAECSKMNLDPFIFFRPAASPNKGPVYAACARRKETRLNPSRV